MQKNGDLKGGTSADDQSIYDDIGAEIAGAATKQLEAERKVWLDNIDRATKGRDNYKTQWEIENRLWEIKLADQGFRPINPTRREEQSEEYWTLQGKMAEFKYREVKHMAEAQLAQYDKQVEEAHTQLALVEEQLKKYEEGAE
jgi:hypothetical protein